MQPPGERTEPGHEEATLAGTGGVAPTRDEPLHRGDEVGRYVVLESIGRGAMGVVYKAFDPELDRAVALKLLLGEEDATRQRRLTREAQAIAKVSHPNVIAVHDVGTHEGRVFFAMELVDGRSLTRWLVAESPGVEEILEVFRQAGAGLAAAHAAGLVHRDFKPDNVLVDEKGRVRVLDFGLARRPALEPAASDSTASARVDLTRTGAVLGTPAYMSPEQFAGANADARSDQFSFCVALHEALTGKRPFAGETFASLGQAVLAGERISSSFEDTPERVIAALDRGLSPEPERRFPSMDDLLGELASREKPRWGRLALAGVGVVALSSAAAYGLGRSRAAAPLPDPCADTADPIDAVWNPARAAKLSNAFTDSGAANAATVSIRVTSALDAYAQRWRVASARSCELIEVDHALDPELSFRSRHCIGQSLESLSEQLESMSTLDVAAVQLALDSVDRLPNPEACVDSGVLALRVSVPADPQLRARVEELSPSLALARARWEANDATACLELVKAVEQRAHAIGHGPTLVRALRLRTNCEFAADLPDEARNTQQLTFEEALASGCDDIAMGTAADIALGLALRTDELDRAALWLRRADALARRHDMGDSGPKRALLNARGVVAARQGRLDESIEWLGKLADATRDAPGGARDHLTALMNVGAAQANAGLSDDALVSLQRAAAFAEEHWGPGHPTLAEAQDLLAQGLLDANRIEDAREVQRLSLEVTGRYQPQSLHHAFALATATQLETLLGNYDAALEFGRESLRIRDRLDAMSPSDAGELLNTLSRLARELGDLDAAERYAQQCLELRENAPWPLETAEPLVLLARVHWVRGDAPRARELLQRAEGLALSDAPVSQRARKGPTLYRIASVMTDIGNHDRSVELFAQAEALIDEGDRADTNSVRLQYAATLHSLGRADEARALLDEVETIYASYPYPRTLLAEAAALRAKLGG